jgi:hypothetical protein
MRCGGVHSGEVSVSNFVFGAGAGWLMSPARAILPAERGSVAAPLKEIAHERVR